MSRYVSKLALTALAVLVACLVLPSALDAAHTAPHQCGVKSSSFARICRPGANASCLGAVERGVKGFTRAICDQRREACSKCLNDVQVCVSRIGHWPKLTHTCEKCTKRFDTCIEKRYPKL